MKNILLIMIVLAMTAISQAAYKETMDPDGLTKNLKTDFGLVDDHAESNQSEKPHHPQRNVSVLWGGNEIERAHFGGKRNRH